MKTTNRKIIFLIKIAMLFVGILAAVLIVFEWFFHL
jgi:uncharacterized membrane protein YiaA